MAIATPIQLGTAGGVAAASYVITTAANIPAGATVFITVAIAGTTETISSITDSSGNVYPASANFTGTAISLCRVTLFNALAMLSGNSITVNLSAGTAIAACEAFVCSTQLIQDVAPGGQTGVAATTATTIASGTLSHNDGLLIGMVSTAAAISAFTPGGSFTSIGGLDQTGASVNTAYQIVASNASVNWAPSWTTAANYISLFRGYVEVIPLPVRSYDEPNPVRSKSLTAAALRSQGEVWQDRQVNLYIGQDTMFGAAGQVPAFDWQLPVPLKDPKRVAARTTIENWQNFPGGLRKGSDVFFGLAGNPNFDLPNPTVKLPNKELRTFLNPAEVWLIGQDRFFGVAGNPLSDFPNPTVKKPNLELRTFLNPAEVQLIGQDKFFGAPGQAPANLDWPNPTRLKPPASNRWFYPNTVVLVPNSFTQIATGIVAFAVSIGKAISSIIPTGVVGALVGTVVRATGKIISGVFGPFIGTTSSSKVLSVAATAMVNLVATIQKTVGFQFLATTVVLAGTILFWIKETVISVIWTDEPGDEG